MTGGARRRRAPLAAVLVLALAGCSTVPGGAPLTGRLPVGPVALDREGARRAIALYRRAHGLGDVELDPALNSVAQGQADAMARADRLSHDVVGDLSTRIAAAGLHRGAEAENVSAGYPSFERALGGWQRSPAHDANLLFRPARRIGVAAAAAPGTRFGTFWALVMTD